MARVFKKPEKTPPPPPPQPSVREAEGVAPEAAIIELDAVLRALVAEHEGLLALAGKHKRAIGAADVGGMSACIGAQSEAAGRIAVLERRRMAAVRAAAGNEGMTISAIAARTPEPAGSRLGRLGKTLRETIDRLHREHMVIREAAQAMSGHLEGLMRQVYRRMSHAGTYGRAGAVETNVQVVTALDLKT